MPTLPIFFRGPSGDLTIITGTSVRAIVAAQTPPASYIGDAIAVALRNAMAASHDIGGSSEQSFTGFSDTTGWTEVTVTTATEMAAAIASTAVNQRKVITCNWNGTSTSSGNAMCLQASSLTANEAVDWGYNRPDWSVLVRAGDGYSPVVDKADHLFYIYGANRIEFRGVSFLCQLRHERNSTYPGLPLMALKSCSFTNGGWTLNPNPNNCIVHSGMRVLHVEDCDFKGSRGGIIGPANYFRSWNNRFNGVVDDDIHSIRTFYDFMLDWTAHTWVAGCLVYNTSQELIASGLHPDFLQISSPSANPAAYRTLIEFNIAHLNRNDSVTDGSTQGLFGRQYVGNTAYYCDWCVHNNIFAIGAYWAAFLYDGEDDGAKCAYGNMMVRAASGFDNKDSYPIIAGGRDPESTPGTGYLRVVENYYTFTPSQEGNVSNEVYSGNINCNPTNGATESAKAENILTGNGTWVTGGDGLRRYTAPDAGIEDAATARAALVAFYEPQVGWRGANCGPVDPATWPTSFGGAL